MRDRPQTGPPAWQRTALWTGGLAVACAVLHGGCQPASPSGVPFEDRSRETGLVFHHLNGGWGETYIAEVMGPGCALFDFDDDGDLDVYIAQGRMLGEGKTPADATVPPREPFRAGDRLFRSDLVETGSLRFTDVTAEAGIRADGYGMGVTVGDYDGDGWPDLYITNLGPNQLLRNTGEGTFDDVTEESGAQDDRWSASAVFVDHDADGDLDLYVTNYVDFSLANHRTCYSSTGARDYCGPSSYRSYPDSLFRNRGDGTFEDVSAAARISGSRGAGLGVIAGDFDGDRLVDLYVANDAEPNNLWINRGDGTFEDLAVVSGCAFNMDGRAESSMGVDAGDVDGDGDEDLFLTHLRGETNTLYLNNGKGIFEDHTFDAGLGVPSRNFTGFGTGFLDYDNDGWLDIIVANGAAHIMPELARAGDPFPLHQTNQIFRNLDGGGFEETTAAAGALFEKSEVGRGLAFGDVDNDGDTDVLLTNNNGPARLLVNVAGDDNHWIGFRVVDETGRNDVLGARVEVVLPDRRAIWRTVRTAASYLSSNDPRVLVGLGGRTSVAAVRVHWPGGAIEEWTDPAVGRYLVLKRGAGRETDR